MPPQNPITRQCRQPLILQQGESAFSPCAPSPASMRAGIRWNDDPRNPQTPQSSHLQPAKPGRPVAKIRPFKQTGQPVRDQPGAQQNNRRRHKCPGPSCRPVRHCRAGRNPRLHGCGRPASGRPRAASAAGSRRGPAACVPQAWVRLAIVTRKRYACLPRAGISKNNFNI